MFGDKYLKTKIKSFNDKITITFYGKAPKTAIKCVCLSAMVIDSVFKSDKNLYPQAFIEECKYKDIKSFIEDDLESFSDDEAEKEEKLE